MYYATHAICYVYRNIYARKLISVIDTDLEIYIRTKTIRHFEGWKFGEFSPRPSFDWFSSLRAILVISHSEKHLANLMEPRCQHRKIRWRNLNDGEAIERYSRDAKTSWQLFENRINVACGLWMLYKFFKIYFQQLYISQTHNR